jgi:hypothetical protein
MSAATRAKSARARAMIAIRMLKTVRHLGRAFDDCFEMHDGNEVVRWILHRAQTDHQLARIIAERGFGSWFACAVKAPQQKELL